ncbi:hypothetical protein HZA57_03415 [Candidatus Poribacteria bacterium]|nr:hypothetical protein [Candidatus Poribacteria bacterium]
MATERERHERSSEGTGRMHKSATPRDVLLARLRTWCGVEVARDGSRYLLSIRNKPIARFPSEDSLEAVLCGSIRDQVRSDPACLPSGTWTCGDHTVVMIDLTAPGGMEEAVRVLLNAYILSQAPEARDWWLSDHHMSEDPTCERLEEVIRRHRGTSG